LQQIFKLQKTLKNIIFEFGNQLKSVQEGALKKRANLEKNVLAITAPGQEWRLLHRQFTIDNSGVNKKQVQ